MHLIVGLGNPGKEYEKTRHNVGFMILDNLSHCAPSPSPLPSGERIEVRGNWKSDKKFKAEISKGEIDDEKVILAKPQTFMNASGEAVKLITYNLKLKTSDLWVIHDDLDLALGTMRISFGSGSAGHKGVQSIIDALGTKDFWRLRIGIGPSPTPHPHPLPQGEMEKAEKFVLRPFKKDEQKLLKETLNKAVEALTLALKDPQKAMSLYNQ